MKIPFNPIGVFVGFSIALTACTRTLPPTPAIEGNSPVPPAPTHHRPDPLVCNTSYTRHELTAPYRQDAYNPQPIYTFAPEEFSTMLSGLDITSVCIPEDAGAPYALFDWKVEDGSAQQGRMTTLSFDSWRKAQIVYATYDFIKGTEYELFATAADYVAVKNTNTREFERVFVGLCYGKCYVYKTFIHPFADHYIAATLNLGAYDYGSNVETQVSKFNAGEYPAELQDDLARFDNFARSLELAKP